MRLLSRVAVALLLSGACAAPAAAQTPFQIADAEHRIYRDRIAGLFDDLADVPDEAPMASARRLHLLAQVGFWRRTVIDWPGLARPTDMQLLLTTDPGRAVPQLAVPLERQVAAELDRVDRAARACLAAPDTACLMDAAAAYASASQSLVGAQARHLRLVHVARLAGDAARMGLLREMAMAEVPLYERARAVDGKSPYSGLSQRAMLFRMAGFETEAHQLARQVSTRVRLTPGNPFATFANLISDEYDWRQGKMTAGALASEAQYFIAAHDGKSEAAERQVPDLLLTVMAVVEAGPAFEARARARIAGLPAADSRNSGALLAITLGRLGHAPLLAEFPAVRVAEMLAEPPPAADAVGASYSLGLRMLTAAWLGRGDVAGPYRQRLLEVMAALPPPEVDLSRDAAGMRSGGFAHLAEVQAMLAR